MKTTKLLTASFFMSICLLASGKTKNDEIVKTGLNFGALPILNYNTDLGFQMGAMGQIYDYGDGSIYPNYKHKTNVILSLYSKGAKQIDITYDSKYLIPRKRITAGIEYLDSPLNGFYGFNGAVSPYYQDLNCVKTSDGKDGIAFYANHLRLFSSNADIQGKISEHVTWIAGLKASWQNYEPVSLKPYTSGESLYSQYLESGLIPESDTHGFRGEIKGGIVYDTRDFEANPSKGLYATAFLTPGLSISGSSRFSLQFDFEMRHFISIIPSHLVFAYQLAYQGLVAGSLPFYSLPAFGMRGSFGRRIVGDGIAKASSDLRYTITRFQTRRQNIELGIVGFAEAGGVVQQHMVNKQKACGEYTVEKDIDGTLHGPFNSIYDPTVGSDKERLHSNIGGGIFFAINRNFLVSLQRTHTLRSQDGGNGFYINLGFAF